MKLELEVKNVFGKKKYYPKCQISNIFVRLMKQICFTEENIKYLKDMGVEIKSVTPDII